MDRKYNLKLDLLFRCNNSTMKFDEFDKNTSDFFIRITRGNELIDISNAIVILAAIKPDNTTDVQFVEIRDNNVYCDLKASMKNQVGKYEAIASIVMNNETVITDTITYEVTENKILKQLNTEVVAEERFTILTDMINRLSKIELQETSRQEAELSREEAEKLRQQAIEKVKTDISKLISDTNNKVANNLAEQNNKVTKLISDTETKIDNYKTEKDEAIQQDLQLYKQETTKNIDDYKVSKDAEINKNLSDYKTNTTNDINNYKNLKNTEIDKYKAAKDLEIDTYISNKNAELDQYVVNKNTEIDEYKEAKDTLINDKLREVDTAEQSRVEAEQKRVTDHAERETFLNSFESQLGQIETDVKELKENGAGNANIDDTQIRKDATWSSDKISTWSMEQDGVFWTEKEDNFVSADDTYEYKLKEIEIFGDTWQDSDSKNLFDEIIEQGAINNSDGQDIDSTTLYRSTNNLILDKAKSYCFSSNISSSWCYWYDIDGNYLSRTALYNNSSINFVENGHSVRLQFDIKPTWAQIEEGSKATTYEPYHKADLSNIQHAGELYTDEEGQPILDSEGREQYKFEIEVCNANLFDGILKQGQLEIGNGVATIKPTDRSVAEEYIKIIPNSTIWISRDKGLGIRICWYDKNKVFLNYSQIGTESKYKINSPSNAKYVRVCLLNSDATEKVQVEINSMATDIIPHQSNKTTILLPCQLSKVGDVKDRLYWDNEKGKYVVEKNVGVKPFNDFGNKSYTCEERAEYWQLRATLNSDISNIYCPYNVTFDITGLTPINSNILAFKALQYKQSTNKAEHILIWVKKECFESALTPKETEQWFNDNNENIYYQLATPQLIETNITTPITIPTYNNKTHVYVVNSNNTKATIKAKFPLKTASAVASVKELGLKNSNSIQEQYEVNQTQDSLIDISLCATDEMYMMIEPLLQSVPQTLQISERMVSKMVDMYVAMVIRGLKTIDEVPARYREQVKEILSKLEK